MTSLFSVAYAPPISYLKRCMESDLIIIDSHEHFIKQTYRNRCNIYGPNGIQILIIPVVHENLFRIPIIDVRISYDSQWKKIHWKAICSAYRNAPYFEFYEDDLGKIYNEPCELLFEFDLKIIRFLFDSFKIKNSFSFSEKYESNPSSSEDLRNIFHPKKNLFKIDPYHQVFAERHGFINDLSCLDLLFNTGPK